MKFSLSPWFPIFRSALHGRTFVLLCLLQGIVTIFFFGCAGQLPPPGGPPDTKPPEIVETFPPNNATNVDTRYFELKFSELVDRRSVRESIFISPPLKPLEFDWSGRKVKVRFDETLKKNTTYVVNIGTDVVDTRAGNRMAAARTLAFSSGDVIDPGAIEGRVYDDEAEGLMVFGYRLDHLQPDTLNPSVTKPDYVTQTGKGGLFALNFVALGDYRLFTVRDVYRNLLYDPEVDAYGVPQSGVTLTSDQPTVTGVRFRLAKEDTSGPILAGAKSPDRSHLEIRFNEPVQTSIPWRQAISLHDTLRGTVVDVLSVFSHAQNPEVFTVVTATQDSSAMYRVTISAVSDHQANPIRPEARSTLFQASDILDERAPELLFTSIRDSARGVPFSRALDLQFDDAVQHLPVERSLTVVDSTGAAVQGVVRWTSEASIQFSPVPKWKRKMWYAVALAMDSLVDLNGNRGPRDTVKLRFETMDDKMLGSIEGEVTDAQEEHTTGDVIVTARPVNRGSEERHTIRRPRSGAFEISDVVDGMYVIHAFRDEDENGSYSFGRPFPFRPSERFTVYPDTITVRARWPVEGVRIRLD